jgi:maltodextrin utilization protein YvdJ
MAKKIKEELNDENGLVGDNLADDLSDVKKQLKKLQKDSADPDEDEGSAMAFEEDNSAEVSEAVSEDIVIHEEYSLPFNDEDKYYKSLSKLKKEQQDKK